MPSGRLFRNATRQHDHSTCLLDIVAEIDDTRCMQAVICQPALHHMSVHRKRILCAVGRPDVPSRVRPVRPPSAADEYLRWRLKLAERRLACLYRKRHSAPDCVTRKPPLQARSYPSHSSYDVSAAMSPAFREAQSIESIFSQYILRQDHTNKAYISKIFIRKYVFTAIIASILWPQRELSQVTC
jgi:hypothetical protein